MGKWVSREIKGGMRGGRGAGSRRGARRRGAGGAILAPLVRPLPSIAPLYERGGVHSTYRPILSLITPRCPYVPYIIITYYMMYY